MSQNYYSLWYNGLSDDPVAGQGLKVGDPRRDARTWFKDYVYTKYPTRAQLQDGDPELVLAGWRPAAPFIDRDTRVLAFGSCFAGHFAEWLANNGYNQEFTASCRALLRNPFENTAVIAQLFRWAFGEVDPSSLLWVDKHKQQLLATEERRLAVCQMLLDADVFITTLAMAETWYDKASGETLWRVLPQDLYDPEHHSNKVLSFSENIQALEAIDRIRRQWLPKLRIIFTVSPLPIVSTFRPISAVTANSASKAIIRGALDEFLRSRSEELNSTYFYFPSFELVTTMFNNQVFQRDGHHLFPHAIDAVIRAFASLYTTEHFGSPLRERPEWQEVVRDAAADVMLERDNDVLEQENYELRNNCFELQRACNIQFSRVRRLKRRLIFSRLEAGLRRWRKSLVRRMFAARSTGITH